MDSGDVRGERGVVIGLERTKTAPLPHAASLVRGTSPDVCYATLGRPATAMKEGSGYGLPRMVGFEGSVKSESGTVEDRFVASIDQVAPWTAKRCSSGMPSEL